MVNMFTCSQAPEKEILAWGEEKKADIFRQTAEKMVRFIRAEGLEGHARSALSRGRKEENR